MRQLIALAALMGAFPLSSHAHDFAPLLQAVNLRATNGYLILEDTRPGRTAEEKERLTRYDWTPTSLLCVTKLTVVPSGKPQSAPSELTFASGTFEGRTWQFNNRQLHFTKVPSQAQLEMEKHLDGLSIEEFTLNRYVARGVDTFPFKTMRITAEGELSCQSHDRVPMKGRAFKLPDGLSYRLEYGIQDSAHRFIDEVTLTNVPSLGLLPLRTSVSIVHGDETNSILSFRLVAAGSNTKAEFDPVKLFPTALRFEREGDQVRALNAPMIGKPPLDPTPLSSSRPRYKVYLDVLLLVIAAATIGWGWRQRAKSA